MNCKREVEAAKQAIQDVFGNSSVPISATREAREALEELKSDIEDYLSTLSSDDEDDT